MAGIRLTTDEILERIPHGRQALLLDGAELEPRRSVTCDVKLSGDERFFADHYPDMPILPGHILVEMFAQAGAILCADDRREGTDLLVSIEAVRFRAPTSPPAALTISAELRTRRLSVVWLDCRACRKDGEVVAHGSLIVALGRR
ncbi:MAG: hypothetical protein P4L84_29490 [Isosphaeraceae bacterium]|nr:hypothetical protein [Isosphaeraceae bacterium]